MAERTWSERKPWLSIEHCTGRLSALAGDADPAVPAAAVKFNNVSNHDVAIDKAVLDRAMSPIRQLADVLTCRADDTGDTREDEPDSLSNMRRGSRARLEAQLVYSLAEVDRLFCSRLPVTGASGTRSCADGFGVLDLAAGCMVGDEIGFRYRLCGAGA
jgi:hypothetical protein